MICDARNLFAGARMSKWLKPSTGKNFTTALLRQLLENTCDASGRTEISKLQEGNIVRRIALASVDSCIATRKRLDPMFRAWLHKVAVR